MDRRSFIARTLTALAAIPLLGKIASLVTTPEPMPPGFLWANTRIGPQGTPLSLADVGPDGVKSVSGAYYGTVYFNHPSGRPWEEIDLDNRDFSIDLPEA